MLIVCFAVGRDRDNWRGRKAWREGKGFSPSFCWFLFHAHCVSPCVSVFSESQSCAAYYEKSNFNRARRNTRQFRQHVFSPSGTAWFCRARRRDGDRRWKGEHGLNLSPFASITIRCCPTYILICYISRRFLFLIFCRLKAWSVNLWIVSCSPACDVSLIVACGSSRGIEGKPATPGRQVNRGRW